MQHGEPPMNVKKLRHWGTSLKHLISLIYPTRDRLTRFLGVGIAWVGVLGDVLGECLRDSELIPYTLSFRFSASN